MKYITGTLTAVALLTLGACDSATSRIENDAQSQVTYDQNSADNNQGLTANDVVSAGNGEFSFDRTEHDFGDIPEGVTKETTFAFTNTGDAPLIISNAKGSCGCTVPEWPRTPIQPGESAEMKVSFNSANKSGTERKTVTITANTVPPTTVLTIKANVQR